MARTHRTIGALACSAALLAALATGCGKDPDPMADGRVEVATSSAALASIASNVAGTHAHVTAAVPEQDDVHGYEPGAAARRALAKADLILLNGMGLDEPVEDLARDAKRSGVSIVKVGDQAVPDDQVITTPSEDGDTTNPHAWLDPVLAKAYVAEVADRLAGLDGGHADDYRKNAAALTKRIDVLDRAAKRSVATIPKKRRTFLAYHDAMPYLAQRYGLRSLSALQHPDLHKPTAAEVTGTAKVIRSKHVPAVFGSVEFPSAVPTKLAAATGATYGGALRDDDLPGAPDEPGHSWLGLVQYDLVAIVTALGGNPAALQAVDTTDVGPTRASYPQ